MVDDSMDPMLLSLMAELADEEEEAEEEEQQQEQQLLQHQMRQSMEGGMCLTRPQQLQQQ